MRFLERLVILADLLISFIYLFFILLLFYFILFYFLQSHTSVLALLTSISAKHYTPSPKIIPSALPLQGDISNTLPYGDWSGNERVLLSLADQYKIRRNKLKFPLRKNAHNITESC
jgi:hypothetical protein